MENAEGSASMEDDRFEVANRGQIGPSRRRTLLLKKILPRIHLRYNRATDLGAFKQRQLEVLWRSVNLGIKRSQTRTKAASKCKGEGEMTPKHRALIDASF